MVCVATCVSASSMEIDIPRWLLSRYLHRYLNLSKGKWKIVALEQSMKLKGFIIYHI